MTKLKTASYSDIKLKSKLLKARLALVIKLLRLLRNTKQLNT